jgi:hypothetical protein
LYFVGTIISCALYELLACQSGVLTTQIARTAPPPPLTQMFWSLAFSTWSSRSFAGHIAALDAGDPLGVLPLPLPLPLPQPVASMTNVPKVTPKTHPKTEDAHLLFFKRFPLSILFAEILS